MDKMKEKIVFQAAIQVYDEQHIHTISIDSIWLSFPFGKYTFALYFAYVSRISEVNTKKEMKINSI